MKLSASDKLRPLIRTLSKNLILTMELYFCFSAMETSNRNWSQLLAVPLTFSTHFFVKQTWWATRQLLRKLMVYLCYASMVSRAPELLYCQALRPQNGQTLLRSLYWWHVLPDNWLSSSRIAEKFMKSWYSLIKLIKANIYQILSGFISNTPKLSANFVIK